MLSSGTGGSYGERALKSRSLPFVLSLSKDKEERSVVAFHVYILRCSDGAYYIGHADDLEARIAAHEAGEMPGYTKSRLPVALQYAYEFSSRVEALERERQLKGWTRRKKQTLIRGDWDLLIRLSKPRGSTSSPQTVEDQRD